MKQATISDAPTVLNINDRAMWVLGYNAALDALTVKASELAPKYAEAGPLLELDALLGALVMAVLKHAETGESDDLAGVAEVKAIQKHVRQMLVGLMASKPCSPEQAIAAWNRNAGVMASRPMQPTPYGLAEIEGDAIVIRLTADACAFAFANDPQARESRPPVIDKQQFLRDTLNELTAEREDGSTLLTDVLDRAMVKAMENGSDALDHDAAGVKGLDRG